MCAGRAAAIIGVPTAPPGAPPPNRNPTRPMPATTARRAATAVAVAAAALTAYACADAARPAGPTDALAASGRPREAGVLRQYGPPAKVGHGRARAYVLLDADTRAPLELGVALDEGAMDGLPAAAHHGGGDDPHAHADSHEYLLDLPAQNPTPFTFVELNWNPGGHEPPGVYDVPHFDFHFYTIPLAQRNAIDPAALGPEQFLAKSGHLPPAAERVPGFAALSAPGQPVVAVPRMGVHWSDLSAPELQGMFGNPGAHRPFTTTFTYGSWDGDFIFAEPMVTRAFLLGRRAAATAAQRDSVIPLATPQQQRPAGAFPAVYHVTWDEHAREYRVGLQQFAPR
jgi:hypothetical protein